MNLFHVTPLRNLASILRHGIDPAFSQTGKPECWYVKRHVLGWAIKHVCDKFGIKRHEVCVLEVTLARCRVVNRGNGRYTSGMVIGDIDKVRKSPAAY